MASAFPPVTPLQGVSGYRLIAKSVKPEVGIFQTGALRAPEGPQTAFASEQVIDMLAKAAGMDPYAFRVQNMRTDTYGEDWEGSTLGRRAHRRGGRREVGRLRAARARPRS